MNSSLEKLLKDLLVVIVIYRISLESSITWKTLIEGLQGSTTIFIYDNSLQPQELPESLHGTLYHHDPTNKGVSAAYNKALTKASELNKGWLLLLDQDTELSIDFISKCAEGVNAYADQSFFAPALKDKNGIVSPFQYKEGISKRIKSLRKGLYGFSSFRVANSGTLVRREVLESVNGFNEKLPLDFSDIYLQEKLLAHKKSKFVIIDSTANHDFSGTTTSNKRDHLHRFRIFCNACITMSGLTKNVNNFRWVSFKRSLKLSFQYYTFQFLNLHLTLWRSK